MESAVKHWRRQKTVVQKLGRQGKVLSWTTIHVAGTNYKDQTPYIVVMVKLDNGEKLVGQLVDCFDESELHIGNKVISVLRKLRNSHKEEIIPYGVKFKRLAK